MIVNSTKQEISDLMMTEALNSYQYQRHWRSAAKSFANLNEIQSKLAIKGIERHFNACRKQDILPSHSACLEIILDARDGRQIWKESDKFF